MRTKVSPPAANVTLRPLSTRSVILSLLLGVHPPELSVRQLIRSIQPFGVAEATLRVALSRMVADGDLYRADSAYRLSDRLVERQRRQDGAIHPTTKAWRRDWEIAVITATGRHPAQRAQLRDELSRLRLAELREGVWLRPANLRRAWPDHLTALTQRFIARPDQPHQILVDTLWTIDSWASTATGLLNAFTTAAQPADSFTVAAAIIRHLLTDPVLPDQLLPTNWPAPQLRAAYAKYQNEVLRLARTGGNATEASE
jgi:phenylacetic acid degradation operon negative regulatory protein